MTKLADANVEDWARLYQTNVLSGVALVKNVIPELRKTKGCVVWVSSGAAMKPYVSWGAYGSSKAALHSIASHLAVEEPDICSVSIQPGRVDTDMQKEVREQGQAAMHPEEYDGFATAFREGKLARPEEPAGVIANVVVAPKSQLSGANFKFGAPELAEYQGS
jgi:NAD(P)-dependent dehydrogenase (short-subunit alcohol dehydrogenase family)